MAEVPGGAQVLDSSLCTEVFSIPALTASPPGRRVDRYDGHRLRPRSRWSASPAAVKAATSSSRPSVKWDQLS